MKPSFFVESIFNSRLLQWATAKKDCRGGCPQQPQPKNGWDNFTCTLYIFICLIMFASCDIRRRDKVADDVNLRNEQAAKDTTEVQLIDSMYNFGNVTEGEKVTFSFRFKNIGKKSLVIANAHASCGCTVPEKPEKPILAGDTGVIKVVFNTMGKGGHQEKNITVESNTSPAFPELKLVGEVEAQKK